eukprot:gene3572-4451_t
MNPQHYYFYTPPPPYTPPVVQQQPQMQQPNSTSVPSPPLQLQQQQQQQQQHHQIQPIEQCALNLYSKFQNFNNLFGSNMVKFETYALPSAKELNNWVFKIQSGLHTLTSLRPFVIPNRMFIPPQELNKADMIQIYLDGISSLLVAITFCSNPTTKLKMIPLFIVRAAFMIEVLNKNLQQNQQLQSTSSNQCNQIIQQFKKELDNIKSLISLIEVSINSSSNSNGQQQQQQQSQLSPNTFVYYSQTLFSLLTNKGYFWCFGDVVEPLDNNSNNNNHQQQQNKNSLHNSSEMWKLPLFDPIYQNLSRIVAISENTGYKYDFGCYCFSFFKIYQSINQIDSIRFVNYTNKPSFDKKIYDQLIFFLKKSHESFISAFKDPISSSDIEDKAHTWIQYFINDAHDRIQAASIIQQDQDINHYHSKIWYKELMNSIEEEKKKKQLEDQKQQDIYLEFKNNLIIDGYAPKNMNHDCSLISSLILANLHPPPQSKIAELAQKRLSERLELYMLKNSKEIPGDGNCQMHALSDQIYGDLNHSFEIRKTIVDWLRKNKDFSFPNGATLHQFVNGSWEDYCDEMSKSGVWGDHLTLLAAAEIFGSKISIISSVESTSHFFIEIIPTKIQKDKVILLSHYSEFHYGSLCFIS